MELSSQFKKLMQDFEKDVLPETKRMISIVKDQLKEHTPISIKKIMIEGFECTVALYEDRITINFPSKEMSKKAYDNY